MPKASFQHTVGIDLTSLTTERGEILIGFQLTKMVLMKIEIVFETNCITTIQLGDQLYIHCFRKNQIHIVCTVYVFPS